MEGVTLGLAYGLNRFRELGIAAHGNPPHRRRQQERRLAADRADIFGVPTVCLQSAEGAALGAAIQGGYACIVAHGQQATFRDLCETKFVKLDDATRAKPHAGHKELYADLLTRQGDLTRRLHAADYFKKKTPPRGRRRGGGLSPAPARSARLHGA